MGEEVFMAAPEDVDPEENIIALYYVESPLGLWRAGVEIAKEESIGTWTELTTITRRVQERLAARVFRVDEDKRLVWVAYPLELFDLECGGIPNLLSIVAGNLFGLSALENVRLLDIQVPRGAARFFPGPKFGVDGVRAIVGTKPGVPHLGTIIKPKVGLNPKETAQVAYEAAVGGVDFVKDDETLVNQRFCPLGERVSRVMEALDRAREETGRRVLYAVNVTANHQQVLELADLALENGANMLMVDVLTAGFPAVQVLAEDPSVDVPLHIHRAMHAAMTRNPRHGIHMAVIAKLVRLAGGDQLHTGTAAGKMEKEAEEVRKINDFLRADWHGLKTVFPVASGGIHPGIVDENLKALGFDIVINAGGGIHGHPMGVRAGATAMRQAIEAALEGVPVEEYAKTHVELRVALEKWGRKFS